jgi:arabinogalactan oligomer/maltooligosaccharide transport system permease protein
MIPWAIPQYIAVVTWKNMFRGQYGTIDILLKKSGFTASDGCPIPTGPSSRRSSPTFGWGFRL